MLPVECKKTESQGAMAEIEATFSYENSNSHYLRHHRSHGRNNCEGTVLQSTRTLERSASPSSVCPRAEFQPWTRFTFCSAGKCDSAKQPDSNYSWSPGSCSGSRSSRSLSSVAANPLATSIAATSIAATSIASDPRAATTCRCAAAANTLPSSSTHSTTATNRDSI